MAIDPLTAAKASYMLGWTNIIGLLLVLFSCRCIMNLNQEKLSKSKFYIKFYQYHCYYWWFFIISVLLHAIMAIMAFGNPFIG
jgi:hypothetical protein